MINWIRTLLRYAGLMLAIYWSALFIATHIPLKGRQVERWLYSDKVVHVAGYAGLSFLAATAWRARRRLRAAHYACIILGLSAYAALDELLQTLPFVRRQGDVRDWIADMVGAALGLMLFLLARHAAHRFGWRVETATEPAEIVEDDECRIAEPAGAS